MKENLLKNLRLNYNIIKKSVIRNEKNMDSYDLSIIIPHYNSPNLLECLIKSIPKNKGIQIIVVDDNSSNEKEEFERVKKIYSHRVEFYINDTGVQSAGSCRNIGLEHAEGKWILFADADDYFLPGMYDIVKQYFDSDYDMVMFTPTSVILGTECISNRHEHMARVIDEYIQQPSEKNYLAMTVFDNTSPWSKMIRREMIEINQIRFNQSLYWNDVMFSTKLGYYCKKSAASYKKIYCITRSTGSLTTQMSEKAFDIRLNEHLQRCVFLREKYGDELCNKMHITGAALLYTAMQQKYGIKKYIEIIRKFHENNIPIIPLNAYSPVHVVKMILHRKKQIAEERKYYVNS